MEEEEEEGGGVAVDMWMGRSVLHGSGLFMLGVMTLIKVGFTSEGGTREIAENFFAGLPNFPQLSDFSFLPPFRRQAGDKMRGSLVPRLSLSLETRLDEGGIHAAYAYWG